MSKAKSFLTSSNAFLVYLLVVMIAVVTAINPNFLSAENFLTILRSSAYSGIFAIGFLFVLICGGLDVSFAAVATVGQYIAGTVMIRAPETPWIFVVIIPPLTGVILASLNAYMIQKLNAPPLIITIAVQNILFGILQFITDGRWLSNFPKWFNEFPLKLVISAENRNGVLYGLSVLTVIWFAVAILGDFILKKTVHGRRLYAMGGNMEAARRAGIDILKYQVFAYGFLGFCSGLAGLVHTMVTQTVAPNTLIGNEFYTIAAVVLGGASIFGGSGSVFGTVMGVVIMAVLSNALTIMRVPAYWHQVFTGAILIASMAVTAAHARRALKKG